MLRFLVISALLLGLSACSPLTSASGASSTLKPPSENPAANPLTPAAGLIEPAFTLTPSPGGTTPETSYLTSTPVPSVNESAALAMGQWKVYTKPDWKLSINYPAEWSVNSDASMVVFTPPGGGEPIRLSLSGTSEPAGVEPLPNTRCTKSDNAYGITINRCLDTVSRAYDAQFSIHSQMFSLSTKLRVDLAVYNTMLDSIRNAQ